MNNVHIVYIFAYWNTVYKNNDILKWASIKMWLYSLSYYNVTTCSVLIDNE